MLCLVIFLCLCVCLCFFVLEVGWVLILCLGGNGFYFVLFWWMGLGFSRGSAEVFFRNQKAKMKRVSDKA